MPDAINYGALLRKALREIQSLKTALVAAKTTNREPIAIIGIGCRFPGRANDPAAYWDLLRSGTDAITEVPRSRWDIDAMYDPDPDAPGKMYTRCGGFIEGIEDFDDQFFGVSPLDALNMDPQQRLLLEVAWEALENAGQIAGAVSRTGVYVGSFMDDYLQQNFHAADLRRIDAYNTLGLLRGLAAGRLAYVLDLQGPAMQLDTACSSSLLAAHLAVQGLRSRQCDLALAGGVNLILAPEVTIGLCRMKAMAADGRCKSFDARADGYVRGEGCGIVVLKRLSDALADHDAIHAVIRGSAVNHDGRSNGLTAPNGTAQKTVIREALADAGVDPRQIGLIEAHGTGTSLGDPIEAIALGEVLCQGRDEPLLVGSVKSNFGHLESAAGAAALIKVALSLQHAAIPPSLHFEQPNPHIPWDRLQIAVPRHLTEWSGHRMAGISSFGMSGTNVHMIVEEAPARTRAAHAREPHVLTLSATGEEALDALAKKYVAFLDSADEASLHDLCFTSNRGRRHFDYRLAAKGDSVKTLAEQLRSRRGSRAPKRPRIAFLFPGQGLQLTQSELFKLEVELAQRWMSWGIRPDAVLGHSVGEYAAACVAGVFSFEDGSKLIAERERLMNALSERGTMAAIFASEERVAAAIRPYGDALSIAALNGAHVVISGEAGCMRDVTAQFDAKPLQVANAFHSRLMEPMLDAFEGAVARTSLHPPTFRFVSTLTGDVASDELTAASYWRRHIRQPVRFADAVRNLRCDVLLEIGPAETLIRMARHIADGVTGLPGVFESLAALYELGVDIDWPADGVKVALPTYPFQRKRFWIDAKPRRSESQPSPLAFRLSADSPPYLRDHALDGMLVVPAAAYAAMALQSVEELGTGVALRDVTFPQALTFPIDGSRTLRLSASASLFRFVSLRDESRPFDEASWVTHCSGSFAEAGAAATCDLEALKARFGEEREREPGAGFDIGPSFRWTKGVREGPQEVLCRMESPLAASDFPLHPGLIDSCFRALALCLGADAQEVYAPFRIEALDVAGRPRGGMWCHAQATEITAERLAGNVRLIDESGAVVMQVTGLEARAMRKRDPLYAVEWQRVDAIPAPNDGMVYTCEGPLARVTDDLLAIVKAHDASGRPANVTVVTRGTQAVRPGDRIDPAHSWVWGFSKVVSMEYPHWRWTCVDTDSPEVAGVLRDEPQFAIRDGAYFVPRVVRTHVDAVARPFSATSTYLITGAFGAIGRQVAQWMVENGARNLVLTGRRAEGGPALDANVKVVQANLADPDAVARLFRDSGPIHGIIHAAGVLDDAPLRDLTRERFERVFAAKVHGTWNLHVQSLPLDLEFFVCFSSAASMLGSKGQANYAAANAYMDALMHDRRRLGLPALSINWGPWAGEGMAARAQEHLRSLGFDTLVPAHALQLLGRLIRSDAVQVGAIPGNWQAPPRPAPAEEHFLLLLEKTPPEARRKQLEDHIHRRIVSTMGRDPFPPEQHDLSFFELGMDSLMSLDLRNRLQTDLDLTLPSTIAFEYPTIQELADYLVTTVLARSRTFA